MQPQMGGCWPSFNRTCPCPLPAFIMVYATAQGIIAAGLLVTAGMALGMTIAIFALAAVLLRDRFMVLMGA